LSSWRDQIWQKFTPKMARMTLVSDPDGLLLEAGVQEGIRTRGFEWVQYDDPIAFRYLFESTYRPRWDQGEPVELAVVAPWPAGDRHRWPSDLLQDGRELSFSLTSIFPCLSGPVVAHLNLADLDALFEAILQYASGVLGENDTKDFILRHVFEFAPELIKDAKDLLRMLLRRHYQGLQLPACFDERLIELLRKREVFTHWPLERIIPDRQACFVFLQERWEIAVRQAARKLGGAAHEESQPYGLSIPGPVDIPFDHKEICLCLDNLFYEGMLKPVQIEGHPALPAWMSVGLRLDPGAEWKRRYQHLFTAVATGIPSESARYADWHRLAYTWAELLAMHHGPDAAVADQERAAFRQLQFQLDDTFTRWLFKRYASLITLPPDPPVMLHHVPRFLARRLLHHPNQKLILLVMDGLSLDQWVTLRETVSRQRPDFQFQEAAVFTWIPSITAVSRQALLSGKMPVFFPGSIFSTQKEPNLWMQFWLDDHRVQYEFTLDKSVNILDRPYWRERLGHPKLKVAGVVIHTVDDIMHGMVLGAAGMHNQIRQWAGQPAFSEFLDTLLDLGFRIFLTSDHGNIEAVGCGCPAEGALADSRGERARIYSNQTLRASVKEKFPQSIEWPSIGLPDHYLALLAPPRQAFVGQGETVVSHGGISLEEVIVPWVEIGRQS